EQLAKAEPILEESLKILRKLDQVENEPDILVALGTIALKKGDLKAASDHAQRALALAKGAAYRLKVCDAELLLGHITCSVGDSISAINHERAARRATKCGKVPYIYQIGLAKCDILKSRINSEASGRQACNQKSQ